MKKLAALGVAIAMLSAPVFADTATMSALPGHSMTVTNWYKQTSTAIETAMPVAGGALNKRTPPMIDAKLAAAKAPAIDAAQHRNLPRVAGFLDEIDSGGNPWPSTTDNRATLAL